MEENMRNQGTTELFSELKGWEIRGSRIMLNGYPASPMQVVNACFLREDCTYMKHYELNQKGDVEEVQIDTLPLDDIEPSDPRDAN